MRDCANPSNSNRENACWSSQAHIFKNTTGGRLQVRGHLAVLLACLYVRSAAAQGGANVARMSPSAAELAAFRADLKVAFIADDGGPGTSAGGPAMMRSLVRLGFHDCASTSCDGCIDVGDTSQNPGLGAMVEALAPMCKTHGMGVADCWAAAASMAVEETSYEGATLAQMPLFFGREDAASCSGFTKQNPEAEFPSGQDGFAPTLSYFEDAFGFTERETVAIMGAHSLGRAEPEGSGFTGSWTIAPNTFDNSFYTDMLKGALGWEAGQTNGTNPLWQWTSTTGQQLMLNSDMVLIKDVFDGSTKDKGEPTCTYAECPDSPTLSIAEEYAADNALFVKEFTAAYIKMLTKGNDFCDLEVVPSKGSGAEIEQLYGVTAIKQGCGVSALSPEAVGPTTSGVLEAPATTPGAVGMLPAEAPAELPADFGTPTGVGSVAPPAQDGSGGTDTSGAPAEPTDDSSTRSDTPGASDEATVQPGLQVEDASAPVGAASTAAGQACSLLVALGLATLCCLLH